MAEHARLPLQGIRVVAIEQAVAAPFCSSRMADAGAEVVKIERPEGDFARGYDDVCAGQSSYFVWLNRGKQSLIVDLASHEGKRTLSELLAGADVLVQNLKPGALDRLGFAPREMRMTYPRLVMCSISGYGESGPLSDRKAYDLLIQAESGLSSITGSPDMPGRVGISVVDIATGAMAYSAILEALLARAATGNGADIRISMFDVMADWLSVPLLHQEAGRPPRRMGMAHPSIAPYGIFRTLDGKDILISVQNNREWTRFCALVLDQPQIAGDKRFADNVGRVANRVDLNEIVATAFASMSENRARTLLSQADVAFAAVNDMEALSRHPHLRRIEVETTTGTVSYPAPAPIFVDQPRIYGPVPALGENALGAASHTQEAI